MGTIAIIIAIVAVVIAIIAIVVAKKSKGFKEVVNKTLIEYGPVEHPFTYDEKEKTYRLNGNLKVDGSVVALTKEEE